jgi:hypothetical protein
LVPTGKRYHREAMATSSKVSPQELAKALGTLSYDRTRELVFHLGVEVYVLENIDTTFTGRTRSIQAIQAWLDRDTEASWGKIVSGLKQIGMDVLASEVATQHCPWLLSGAASPFTGSSQPATVPTLHSGVSPAPVAPAVSSPSSPPAIPPDQPPNPPHPLHQPSHQTSH